MNSRGAGFEGCAAGGPLEALGHVGDSAGDEPISAPASAPAITTVAPDQLDEGASWLVDLDQALRTSDPADAEAKLQELCERAGLSYRGHVRVAAIARKHGFVDQATRQLREAIRKRPDRGEPHLQIGRILASKGQKSEAKAALEKARSLEPWNTKVLSSLADLAEQDGDRNAAIAFVELAHALCPHDPRFVLRLAEGLWSIGELQRARHYLLLLVDAPPADERALRAAAVLLGRCGEYLAEIVLLRRALELSPGRASTQLRLAAALRNAGQISEAITLLTRVRSCRPASADAERQLIELLADAGRTEEMSAVIEDVVLGGVGDANVWVQIVRAVDRTQPWSTVRGVIERARKSVGHQTRLMLAEAQAFCDRGLRREEDECLREAEAAFPDHPAVRRYRIDCDVRMGRFDQALEGIAALPAASPQQRAVRELFRGKLAASRLDIDTAVAAFEAAVAADPFHAGALGGLSRAFALRMQVKESRHCIVEANRLNRGHLVARGRSLNPSQSLLGEILNDFSADPEALEAVQEAIARPGDDALFDAVRLYPDYTGAAISLLIRLCHEGRFADRARGEQAAMPDMATPIPRRIHQFWDTPALPLDVAELTASWPLLNPGWDYQRYDHTAARAYLAARTTIDVQRAFRAARSTAQKADIFRLALLLNEGGVYCDADDRCTGPLEGLVAGCSLVLRQEPWGTIGNNFIAVVPNHPFIAAALRDAVTATLRGDAETVWLSTGPGVVTRAFAQWLSGGAHRIGCKQQPTCTLAPTVAAWSTCNGPQTSTECTQVILDARLSRFFVSGCRVSYKVTNHHWARKEFSQAR